jgi:GAF domain-containing protein/HAMP domain-containing protein
MALACLLFLGTAFQVGAWQLWMAAGLLFVGSGVSLAARRLAHRGGAGLAAALIFITLIALFPAAELLWSGLKLVHVAGALVLVPVVARLIMRERWLRWAAANAGLGAGLTLLAGQLSLAPRLDATQLSLVMSFVPGILIGSVVFIGWQIVRAFRIGSLRTRTLIVMVAAAVIPVAAYGAVGSVLSYQAGRQRLIEQLESVATLKEDEVTYWLRDLQNELRTELNRGSIREPVRVVLQKQVSTELWEEAYDELQTEFLVLAMQGQWFDELFLMDAQGRVILSTDEAREDQDFSAELFFQEGIAGRQFTQPPSYSASEGWSRLVVARPVFDREGQVQGVLARRVSTAKLNNIMLKRAGLGQTGETYLVGANQVLLTSLHSGERNAQVHSEAIDLALGKDHLRGSGLYDNARGEAVVGTYRWLPELQAALVAEQSQSEAFRDVYASLRTSLGVMGVFGIIAGLAALLISRSIAVPLADLAETADQIAAGNLALEVEEGQVDEIGMLARAFNSMTAQLRNLIAGLERRVAARTQALAHRSVQLETAARVSETAGRTLNPDELEQQVVELIQRRFNYYYVGLFLVDEAGAWTGEPDRWAVLRAGTGEAGQRMLEAAHKLEVGGTSMIGSCVADGEPRIALDVGEEAVRFENPWLPDTRSELALPLAARGQVIGALTVQSERAAAFSDEDVSILQTMAAQLANAIQNARLFEQTRSTLAETETLYEASRRIVAARDLQAIVAAVAEGVSIPAIRRAELWAVERDASDKVVAFCVAANWHGGAGAPPTPVNTRFSPNERPDARLGLSPDPIFIADAQVDPWLDAATRALLQRQNVRGLAVLALWLGGRQVGALLLQSEEPYHFSEREMRLFRSLAGQVAFAVENLNLLEQSLHRAEELSALNLVARVVGESLERQEMLKNSLAAVLEAVDFEAGLVSLYDPDTKILQLTWQEGLPDPLVRKFAQQGMADTLCELVSETGQALCLADVREEAPVDVTGLVRYGLIAYAGVPLFHKGQVLGTICIFDRGVHQLGPADLALLEAIGRQIGVGLENTRLFEQAQRALARAEAARQETQRALAEAEAVHRRYLRQEWVSFLQREARGFLHGPDGTEPLSASPGGEDGEDAGHLTVPISLRGQTIGHIDLAADGERRWSEADLALAQSFAEQLALAVENARLFELTQQRARRERVIREITDKIRGQTDLETILQTTVRELGRLLGTSRAAVRLGTGSEFASPALDRATDEGGG